MTIIYVGKSGRLNTILHDIISKEISLNIKSAKDYSILDYNSYIIYAGRYLSQSKIDISNISEKFLYLSTFCPNDYYDVYQRQKTKDSVCVSYSGGNVVYIPFIREFLPEKLKERISDKKTGYTVYITTVNDVAKYIINFGVENHHLKVDKLNIKLDFNDKICVKLFSYLYKKSQDKSNLVLNFIKASEKIIQKIFFCLPISCVFIKSDYL